MKVIGFNGSPRKDGNTTTLMSNILREIEKDGIETELVQLSAKKIHGCIACYRISDAPLKMMQQTNI
jgi:multimeric flavodoxin WrbA